MARPWLSVIMPTYNGAAYLSAALDSVLAQQDERIELIAIDDGSTDATVSILESYAGLSRGVGVADPSLRVERA